MANHALHEHDPVLVCVALALCITGGWAASRFLPKLSSVRGVPWFGWLVLSATVMGVSTWCTHFIAMLAYESGAFVKLDQLLTVASLVVAVVGVGGSIALATFKRSPALTTLGGIGVGASLAALHYIGMAAYHVSGTVRWNPQLVVLSIVFAVVFSVGVVFCAQRVSAMSRNLLWAFFVLSILLLHFVGMAAMEVSPNHHDALGHMPDSLSMLTVFVPVLAFVMIATAVAGYLIDDRARAENVKHLRSLALYDQLTSLPNRANFAEHIDNELKWARTSGCTFALIGIDLNNFKDINDRRGHDAGDEVLRVMGSRLARIVSDRPGSFIARVGGDEFIATARFTVAAELDLFIEDLGYALTTAVPLHEGNDEVQPHAAIGVALCPKDGTTAEALTSNADLAMYRSKVDPARAPRFYNQSKDEITRAKRALGADLRDALERDEFQLVYQLQSSVDSKTPIGYEALVRWQHPTQGPVSPMDFIPLAEENGLIIGLGEWVLRTACAAALQFDPGYRIAVNISAVQLTQQRPTLPELVREVLAETGLEARRLEIELTESAVLTDRDRALEMLRQIRALGVRVALDDFGAGYSSLDILRSFPFDRVKIDRSIFDTSADSTQRPAREIIRAITDLGRTFGMTVLAEGIETEEQLAVLREIGVAEAQGFLLGRPSPLKELVGGAPNDRVTIQELPDQAEPAVKPEPELAP